MQAPVPHRLPCVVRINAGVRQGDNVLLFNITNISTVVTTERTPPPLPSFGGVSLRSRNGAPSRKRCVVNGPTTEVSNNLVPAPSPNRRHESIHRLLHAAWLTDAQYDIEGRNLLRVATPSIHPSLHANKRLRAL